MFIQGLACGASDVCSYRVLHVGLVMYVHTGPYMWGWRGVFIHDHGSITPVQWLRNIGPRINYPAQ